MTDTPSHQVVALSTMACASLADPNDWLRLLEALGNPALELDFHVGSAPLDAIMCEVKAGNLKIVSVHNCNPKYVGTPQRYNTGLANLNPDARAVAIEDFTFSLELAAQCEVGFCVGPLGRITPPITEENKLRRLYKEGRDSDEFQQVKEQVMMARGQRVRPHIDALNYSLDVIAPICERLGVKFIPENRYEYGKLGLPDEIRELQGKYPNAIGYCHDFGHAMSVHCLGLWPDEDPLKPSLPVDIWHVNDFNMATLDDHLPFGLGDLPFQRVKDAVTSGGSVAVIEIRSHHKTGDIKSALDQVGAWLNGVRLDADVKSKIH